jgi:hypothetical protein
VPVVRSDRRDAAVARQPLRRVERPAHPVEVGVDVLLPGAEVQRAGQALAVQLQLAGRLPALTVGVAAAPEEQQRADERGEDQPCADRSPVHHEQPIPPAWPQKVRTSIE